MERLKAWSKGTGHGISGDPTTLSRSCSSAFLPTGDGPSVALSKACSLSHFRIFCHLKAAVAPMLDSISSGIGTSSTVSRPSSRSRFGQSFLIGRDRGKDKRGPYLLVCSRVCIRIWLHINNKARIKKEILVLRNSWCFSYWLWAIWC